MDGLLTTKTNVISDDLLRVIESARFLNREEQLLAHRLEIRERWQLKQIDTCARRRKPALGRTSDIQRHHLDTERRRQVPEAAERRS